MEPAVLATFKFRARTDLGVTTGRGRHIFDRMDWPSAKSAGAACVKMIVYGQAEHHEREQAKRNRWKHSRSRSREVLTPCHCSIMLAHGFSNAMLDKLVRDGLATYTNSLALKSL
jgi:hypothetical protein